MQKLKKYLICTHRHLGMAFCVMFALWFVSGVVTGGLSNTDLDDVKDRLHPGLRRRLDRGDGHHELYGGIAYTLDGGAFSESESGRPRAGRFVQPRIRHLALA